MLLSTAIYKLTENHVKSIATGLSNQQTMKSNDSQMFCKNENAQLIF